MVYPYITSPTAWVVNFNVIIATFTNRSTFNSSFETQLEPAMELGKSSSLHLEYINVKITIEDSI